MGRALVGAVAGPLVGSLVGVVVGPSAGAMGFPVGVVIGPCIGAVLGAFAGSLVGAVVGPFLVTDCCTHRLQTVELLVVRAKKTARAALWKATRDCKATFATTLIKLVSSHVGQRV